MNDESFLNDYFDDSIRILSQKKNFKDLISAKDMILATKSASKKLIFAGNGASAAISNHASLDFTKQAKVRSVNFNESALLTSFSNDFGYHKWLEKAVEFYGDKGDTLILTSCSGTSENIVNAAKYANLNGINVITFTGFAPDNPLIEVGDINFWVNSRAYNIIEGIHQIWLLSICDLIIGKKEYSVS